MAGFMRVAIASVAIAAAACAANSSTHTVMEGGKQEVVSVLTELLRRVSRTSSYVVADIGSFQTAMTLDSVAVARLSEAMGDHGTIGLATKDGDCSRSAYTCLVLELESYRDFGDSILVSFVVGGLYPRPECNEAEHSTYHFRRTTSGAHLEKMVLIRGSCGP